MSDDLTPPSDDEATVQRPRPRPRSAEDVSPADAPAEAKAPQSATSRARRIGGRPIVPSAATADTDTKRPAPPPPGVGRHTAAPTAPKVKLDKPAKVKPPKAPATPGAQDQSALVGWIASGVFGVAALVFIVLIAIAAHGVYYAKSGTSNNARTTNQQAALAAAKSCIQTINTYDYRTLPKNEAAALACITGPFSDSMKLTYSKTLEPEAPLAKATQTAQINYGGISAVNDAGTQIQILLYGQFTVTNLQTASSGSPRYDLFGVTVTMNKVNGKWLVAKYVSDTGDSAGK